MTYNISYMAIPGAPRDRVINAKRILSVLTTVYDVDMIELQSRTRKREIVEPRQIAMYLLKKHTRMSLLDIGNLFGGRDHTTAIHSVNTIKDIMTGDEKIRNTIKQIEDRL